MLELRLHPRLKSRIDAADVLQEALLEATRRLPEYLEDRSMPFFVWLRLLAKQKLLDLHRHHLVVQRRDSHREIALGSDGLPGADSGPLADAVLDAHTTPSQAAMRSELRARLQAVLDRMKPADREILVLRQFEQLSNEEAAAELDLQPSAASKRFLRALQSYKEILDGTLD